MFQNQSLSHATTDLVEEITSDIREVYKTGGITQNVLIRDVDMDIEAVLDFISQIDSNGKKIPSHNVNFQIKDLESLLG